MDSKTPNQDDEQPPPYSPQGSETTSFSPSSLASHLHHHLASIPDRLRQTQQARDAQQISQDTHTLDLLLPIVEAFLADLNDQSSATLFLVPDAAVPKHAVLSGLDDMIRRGETVRVSKVPENSDIKKEPAAPKSSAGAGESTWTPGREFTDWGRWDDTSHSSTMDDRSGHQTLWWRDESAARRLAIYLQPQRQPRRSQPPPQPQSADLQTPVQGAVEQSIPAVKGKRSMGWGWRRRHSEAPASAAPPPSEKKASSGKNNEPDAGNDEEDRATMAVSAQEVAFRSENAFGIWESTSGWAIVVNVVVRHPARGA